MKIITMQRLTLDGEPVVYNPKEENGEDYQDWWCVIETEEEEYVYDKFVETTSSNIQNGNTINLWNDMLKIAGRPQGLAWGDDDVYGYIRPDEVEPEVKETYKDPDGDIWVRID